MKRASKRRPRLGGHSALAALAAAVLASACAPFQVRTDYDPEVDFASFETFFWAEPVGADETKPFADNPLLRKRVRTAVIENLEARGYRLAPAEEADFQASFRVTLDIKTVSEVWSGGYTLYPGSYYQASFQEGTLILDIASPAADQLYWRGWVTGAVPTADSSRNRIDLAVREILERFPARKRARAEP